MANGKRKMIYLASDHRGFELKEKLKQRLTEWRYEYEDLGAFEYDKDDDYPDFAVPVAQAVLRTGGLGLLFCGSGVGADIVANKTPGIRSALGFNLRVTRQSREHENVNILSLPADHLNEDEAKKIIFTFLTTPFSAAPRHLRRLKKVKSYETSLS